MMTVKEYAQDTGHSIAEILKKCNELVIRVNSGDYQKMISLFLIILLT